MSQLRGSILSGRVVIRGARVCAEQVRLAVLYRWRAVRRDSRTCGRMAGGFPLGKQDLEAFKGRKPRDLCKLRLVLILLSEGSQGGLFKGRTDAEWRN